MMRRLIGTLLFLAIMVAVLAAVLVRTQTRGVRVTVVNAGPEPLSDVVIYVTGNEYRIGRLQVGESRMVRVCPTGESSVELGFVDHLGHAHRLNAGGYIEPGYRGIIEVELENGAIKRNEHHIELSLF